MLTLLEIQDKIQIELDYRIKAMSKKSVDNLYAPIIYALERGGKRIRPSLLLMVYNLYKNDVETALPAAIAIETFHNFTLLHDDIMDNADLRRNEPTVHKKFSKNAAILSGDGMAFMAYDYLLECRNANNFSLVYETFTKTALEVCEGQQYDMDFEDRNDVSISEYLEMIRLKTAVLLACSLKIGALLANAPKKDYDALYEIGLNMGLAFQLQDDFLDVYGDTKKFGKEIGGDITQNKKTFLMLSALKLEKEKNENALLNWMNKEVFDEKEKISAVTDIYNQLKVKELSKNKVTEYFSKAFEALKKLSVENENKKELENLLKAMQNRTA